MLNIGDCGCESGYHTMMTWPRNDLDEKHVQHVFAESPDTTSECWVAFDFCHDLWWQHAIMIIVIIQWVLNGNICNKKGRLKKTYGSVIVRANFVCNYKCISKILEHERPRFK
jgi:hypothetical protein